MAGGSRWLMAYRPARRVLPHAPRVVAPAGGSHCTTTLHTPVITTRAAFWGARWLRFAHFRDGRRAFGERGGRRDLSAPRRAVFIIARVAVGPRGALKYSPFRRYFHAAQWASVGSPHTRTAPPAPPPGGLAQLNFIVMFAFSIASSFRTSNRAEARHISSPAVFSGPRSNNSRLRSLSLHTPGRQATIVPCRAAILRTEAHALQTVILQRHSGSCSFS